MKKIILTVCLMIIGISILIFAQKDNSTKADIVKTNTPVKIFIDNIIRNQIKMSLSEKYQLTDSPESADVIISSNANVIPDNWSKQILFYKNIDLMPVQFGKFFQGPLDNTKLTIYLASSSEAKTNSYSQDLKSKFDFDNLKQTTILATGDIMLSRAVDTEMDKHGRLYPFQETLELTNDANFTFGNLESPFREGNSISQPMTFGAEKSSLEGLITSGFDAVNLANNHFGNQGQSGMKTTFDVLKGKIDFFGAGTNDTDACKPFIKDINGSLVAFLGYTDTDVIPDSYIANSSHGGVCIMNETTLRINLLDAQQKADFIIVSMHSGTEYTPNPNQRQKDFAHAAIDAGADLVIGHHPHVVQAIEFYKGKFINYSLGNFIFDQSWSKETQQGLVTKFTLTLNQITKIELIPIHISNESQPKIINDQSESESIFTRIFTASEKLRQ
jgi:poly-gamma-glutamate capsule biosynthesis protein CapA/YwtB (metallophosphatase superfamily)